MKEVNKVKNHKQGFTLLELLVVVLIIGILAAIALPQYKNAVRKARVAEAKISLRALVDATDRYILQHGDYDWDSLEDLDVQVETDTKNWHIYVDECMTGETNGGVGCMAWATPKWEEDWDVGYWSTNYEGGEDCEGLCGHFICAAWNESSRKICKSLGGTLIDGYGDGKYYQLN